MSIIQEFLQSLKEDEESFRSEHRKLIRDDAPKIRCTGLVWKMDYRDEIEQRILKLLKEKRES